ncbi:MAG: hypothetical protein KDM91_07205 [Verrucomicrobiae bacterium]|nr:hypothetical protein [Verrucomicrobiae bacterium]MCP5539874.1 hypothetical protein [Akkermansiaceae bacterium]
MESHDASESSSPAPKSAKAGPALRWGRRLAVLFLLWHAAAMTFTLVPNESFLRAALHPVFTPYRELTGADQHWDMFTSPPNYSAFDAKVDAWDAAGNRREFGIVTPGLRPFPGYFRYVTVLTRMESPLYEPYLKPYAAKIEAALREQPGPPLVRFQIRKSARHIQRLDIVRQLDEIDYEVSTLHGPYEIARPR